MTSEGVQCGDLVGKANQLRHLRAKHAWAAFDCPDCIFSCTQLHHLADHRARRHGPGGARTDCPGCELTLARPALVKHIDAKHNGVIEHIATFRMCGPSGELVEQCACGGRDMDKQQFATSIGKKFGCR